MKSVIKIVAGLTLIAASMNVYAVTLTFVDGLGTDPYPGRKFSPTFPTGSAIPSSAFAVGAEFRNIAAHGTLQGGTPYQKSTINGGEAWTFSNTSALMTAVSGTAPTGGAVSSPSAPAGGPGIGQGTDVFDVALNFLAPTVGSAAGNYYGPAFFTFGDLSDGIANVGDTFSITAPTLEGQWAGSLLPAGSYLPLANIVFNGTITGPDGAFHLWAEHFVSAAEEPDAGGAFVHTTFQWNYHGNISALAVPEASTYGMMLTGLGLVGAMVCRRRNCST